MYQKKTVEIKLPLSKLDSMQNPFDSGHIKNYILFYVGVVVIMVLFFIAATLFRDESIVDKKVFDTTISDVDEKTKDIQNPKKDETEPSSKFKLLKKGY